MPYMVGKLLMWEIILCDHEDIFGDFWQARNLRDTRDSKESYFSKCVLAYLPNKYSFSALRWLIFSSGHHENWLQKLVIILGYFGPTHSLSCTSMFDRIGFPVVTDVSIPLLEGWQSVAWQLGWLLGCVLCPVLVPPPLKAGRQILATFMLLLTLFWPGCENYEADREGTCVSASAL